MEKCGTLEIFRFRLLISLFYLRFQDFHSLSVSVLYGKVRKSEVGQRNMDLMEKGWRPKENIAETGYIEEYVGFSRRHSYYSHWAPEQHRNLELCLIKMYDNIKKWE